MSKLYLNIVLLFFSIKCSAQVSIVTQVDTSFYVGLENKVWIATKKYPLKDLYIVVNGRKNKGVNGEFTIACSTPQRNVPLYVYYKNKIVTTKIIQINRVEDPEVFVFGKTIIKDSLISIKEIPNFHELIAKNNVPFLGFNIRGFSLKTVRNGIVMDSLSFSGSIFDINAKRVLKKVEVGDKILFENIFILHCLNLLYTPMVLSITD